MKILMISDEESNGGAAVSASNLAKGLAEQNDAVSRLVLFPNWRQDNPWHTINFWSRKTIFEKVAARIINILPPVIKNLFAYRRFSSILHKEKPDCINFHNILWGIDRGYSLHMYKMAATQAPVFVTMHDMWNIIGYPYDLRAVKDKRILDNWELPPQHIKGMTEKQITGLRSDLFRNENIYFISPSNWLKDELIKKYPFTSKRISVIPYGINSGIFKPSVKQEARRSLGISGDKINVLASAASLEHVNKGFHILLNTLRQRANKDIRLLVMGDDRIIKKTAFPADLEWVSFGYVADEISKAVIYNAADVLAFPSFADNLPNSVIESIACGTPVIAFDTCGLPDLVKEGQTGWLSKEVDLDTYILAFEKAVHDLKNGIDLSESCRDFALENFTISKQAQAYRKLFLEKTRLQ